MFSLFSSLKLTMVGSSTPLYELDELSALKETLEGLDALLNDDLNGTDDILSN